MSLAFSWTTVKMGSLAAWQVFTGWLETLYAYNPRKYEFQCSYCRKQFKTLPDFYRHLMYKYSGLTRKAIELKLVDCSRAMATSTVYHYHKYKEELSNTQTTEER